jgi:hypothetical protein
LYLIKYRYSGKKTVTAIKAFLGAKKSVLILVTNKTAFFFGRPPTAFFGKITVAVLVLKNLRECF